MKNLKKTLLSLLSLGTITALAACDNGNGGGHEGEAASDEPFRIVFYPNESGSELADAREALTEIVEEAIGREGEIVTTTDYNIAIEEIQNGNSHMAYMGAVGYIVANENNEAVQAAFTNSDAEGGLDDAMYYSFIAVHPDDAAEYEEGDGYSLAPLEGKDMAFVTNTSTSGFQVPGEAIVEEFALDSTEDILDGAVFNNIEFGGSHQVSTAMLLGGNVDAAAFFDADLHSYFTLVEGEDWMPGAIYEVDEGAAAPFDDFVGEQVQIIQATPVLNGPFVLNHDVLTDEEVENLISAFTSDDTANDDRIFVDPEADQPGWFDKTGDERFVEVEDSWYDPIREMGGAE